MRLVFAGGLILALLIGGNLFSPADAGHPPALQSTGGGQHAGKGEQPKTRKLRWPPWLEKLIRDIKRAPRANPPARILRYTYRDQIVYYQPPRCCDFPSRLFDAEGRVICLPDGGITGQGDGKCLDFFEERKDEKLIWRDPRK